MQLDVDLIRVVRDDLIIWRASCWLKGGQYLEFEDIDDDVAMSHLKESLYMLRQDKLEINVRQKI